jgi:putative ABC transport system permease protein
MWQDVRMATRALVKAPGFTFAVLLMLSLGVGANAAIVSVLRAVLLEPLPFEEPERLVVLGESNPGWGATLVSSHAFFEWRSRTSSFERMSTTLFWEENLEHGETPRVILSSTVSPEYFDVLGITPLLGRAFRPEDAGRNKRCPLSTGVDPSWAGPTRGSPRFSKRPEPEPSRADGEGSGSSPA